MIDYVGEVREFRSDLISSSACGRNACSLNLASADIRFSHG